MFIRIIYIYLRIFYTYNILYFDLFNLIYFVTHNTMILLVESKYIYKSQFYQQIYLFFLII